MNVRLVPGEGSVDDLATSLVVIITVAVQLLYVEAILSDPMEVLGHAAEEALNEHAGGNGVDFLS